MKENLRKWQANSKWLIANMYLQYYMNCAIKAHIICIFFFLTTQIASFKRVSMQCHMLWFLSLPQLLCHVIVSPKHFHFILLNFCCVLCTAFFYLLMLPLVAVFLTSQGHSTSVTP